MSDEKDEKDEEDEEEERRRMGACVKTRTHPSESGGKKYEFSTSQHICTWSGSLL